MKFGFDTDTLEVAWTMYRHLFSINPFLFIFGLIYSVSLPIVINHFVHIDQRYLLLIPDIYYSFLGVFTTVVAISWIFRKKKPEISADATQEKLSNSKNSRIVIYSAIIESLIILINLLPFTLGYLITRVFIYSSGALGYLSDLQIKQSIVTIFVYQILLFTWIYFIRILWVILKNTGLELILRILAYPIIIMIVILIGQTRFLPVSMNNHVNSVGLANSIINLAEHKKSIKDIIRDSEQRFHDEVRLIEGKNYNRGSVKPILYFVISALLAIMGFNYLKENYSSDEYLDKSAISAIKYLGICYFIGFLFFILTASSYSLTQFYYSIDNKILFIFKSIFTTIANFSSIFSYSMFLESEGKHSFLVVANPNISKFQIFESYDVYNLYQHNAISKFPFIPLQPSSFQDVLNQVNYYPDPSVFSFTELIIMVNLLIASVIVFWFLNRIVIHQLKPWKKAC